MNNEHEHSNYVTYCTISMGCWTKGLSNQWAVGPIGCRTNGVLPVKDQHQVAILG